MTNRLLSDEEKYEIKNIVRNVLGHDFYSLNVNFAIVDKHVTKKLRSEMQLEIEEKFDIVIFEAEILKVSTLQNLYDCITEIRNE